ncbi:MAG: MFS transporter [Bifidobacteriaceae bacterium]|jgi:MFS family permease|nr:MFS transporter [Bifidobacteriaceae bacterium]
MKRSEAAYLASASLSALGNSLCAVILPVLVLMTTGSVLSAGVVALATGLPQFVAAAAGGVVLDRVNRRTAAIAGDVISAVAVAALPIVAATNGLTTGWFAAFGALSALGDVPALTAREALVPELTRITGTQKERLIGVREALSSVSMLAGPALASVLLVTVTPAAALWVTAATSALAGLSMLAVPHNVCQPAASPGPGTGPALVEFIAGARYLLFGNPTLRAVTAVGLAVAVVVAAFQGIVLPVHFTQEGQPGRIGLTLCAIIVGTLVGAGIYAAAHQRLNARVTLAVGSAAVAAGAWALSAIPAFPLIVLSAGVIGVGTGALSALLASLTLDHSPAAMRGRVLGNQNALTMGLAPFVTMGAAVLIDNTGVRGAAVALAGLLTCALVATLASPSLRRRALSGEQPPPSLTRDAAEAK